MSEHRTLQTDPGGDWENRLRAGLHDLETTPAGLPGTDQVRRTHLRRRTALTAASALAAVVVAGGTVLALDRPGTSAPVAPTTTAPTATAAPTPSTTSSTSDPSPATQTTPPSVVPTTIPDGFVLLHESEPSRRPRRHRLAPRRDRSRCAPATSTPDPRTDRRAHGRPRDRQTGPEFCCT